MEIATLTLTFGNAQREFLFRKGTADEAVIFQALKTGACNLGQLRRGPELHALYERVAGSHKTPLIIDTAGNIGADAVFFAYAFPKARVIAIEPDPAKFQLLNANTANLPVECVQAVAGSANAAAPRIDVKDLYDKTPEAQPFILKFAVDAEDLFAVNAEWVEFTPVMIATLSDYLIPGTVGSRAFVQRAAGWNRDFVYLNDNVFSISRSPELMQATA